MLKGIAHPKMNILFIYSEKGCDLLHHFDTCFCFVFLINCMKTELWFSGEIKIYCIYNTVHIIFIILATVYTHKNKKISS